MKKNSHQIKESQSALSLDEVAEAIAYCEANQDVLKQDAESERRYLEERGIDLEPKTAH
jgi:hypothetical protein